MKIKCELSRKCPSKCDYIRVCNKKAVCEFDKKTRKGENAHLGANMYVKIDRKQVRDKMPTVLVVNRRRNLVKFLVIDAKARVQIICPLLTKLR